MGITIRLKNDENDDQFGSKLVLDVTASVIENYLGSSRAQSFTFNDFSPAYLPAVHLRPQDFGTDGEIKVRVFGNYRLKYQSVTYFGDFTQTIVFECSYQKGADNRLTNANIVIDKPMVTDSATHGATNLIPSITSTFSDGQNGALKQYVRVDVAVTLPGGVDAIIDTKSGSLGVKGANMGGSIAKSTSVNAAAATQPLGSFELKLVVDNRDDRADMIAEADKLRIAIIGVVEKPGSHRGLAETETDVDSYMADEIRQWISKLDTFDKKYNGKLPSIREALRKGDISIEFIGLASATGSNTSDGRMLNDKLSRDRAENVRKYIAPRLGLSSKTVAEKTTVEAQGSDHAFWVTQPGSKPGTTVKKPSDLTRLVEIVLDKQEVEVALRKATR